MFLKPKRTQLNPKAQLYKRFTDNHTSTTTLIEDLNTYNITIGEYEVNNYFKTNNFDYTITTQIETSEAQYNKGLLLEEIVFDIEYSSDEIGILQDDDLIVIPNLLGNHLYRVEAPSKVAKRYPKPFYIYKATLRSIL